MAVKNSGSPHVSLFTGRSAVSSATGTSSAIGHRLSKRRYRDYRAVRIPSISPPIRVIVHVCGVVRVVLSMSLGVSFRIPVHVYGTDVNFHTTL